MFARICRFSICTLISLKVNNGLLIFVRTRPHEPIRHPENAVMCDPTELLQQLWADSNYTDVRWKRKRQPGTIYELLTGESLTTPHEQKYRSAVFWMTALICLLFKLGLHAQVDTHQHSASVDRNRPDRWRTDGRGHRWDQTYETDTDSDRQKNTSP